MSNEQKDWEADFQSYCDGVKADYDEQIGIDPNYPFERYLLFRMYDTNLPEKGD